MSFSSVFMSCFVYSADIIAVRVRLVSVIISTVIGYIEKVRLDLVYKYHSNWYSIFGNVVELLIRFIALSLSLCSLCFSVSL